MAPRHLASLTLAAAALLASPLAAQQDDKPTRRSLADGLVRQRIEIDRLAPLKLTVGKELASGNVPMVLLVRRSSGKLEPYAIERGLGDHGTSPDPESLELEPEREIEVRKPGAKPQPKPQPKPGQKPNGNVQPPKNVPQASLDVVRKTPDGAAPFVNVAGIRLEFDAGTLQTKRLRPLLQRLFDKRKGTAVADVMVLRAANDTPLQDVLAVWELAHDVGFRKPLFSGLQGIQPMDPEAKKVLTGLPKRFAWPSQRARVNNQKIYGGELLLLLEQQTTWGEFVSIYAQCAQTGIWRISLVGQRGRERVKLPVDLPFDGGM